ncbi:MAG: DUF2232 domain-containing protein [Spirochaetota bacterium]
MTIDPFQTMIIGTVLLFATSLAAYYWEYKALVITIPLLALCVYRLSGDYNTFTVIASPVVFGTSAGFAIKRRLSVQFYILVSTICAAALTIALYYYLIHAAGVDVMDTIREQMFLLIDESGMQQAEKRTIQENVESVMQIIKKIAPFYFFLNSLIWSVFSFLILRLFYMFFIIRGPVIVKGLEYFRLNDYTIFVLIAFLAAYIFVPEEQFAVIHNTALSGLLITALLYMIQALGIIRYFLISRKLPLFILPLGIFITLLFSWPLLPFVSIILAGWGILDLWTDFRHLKHKNDTSS